MVESRVDLYSRLGMGIRALLLQYNWMNVALIYTIDVEERRCNSFQQDFETALSNNPGSPTIVYKQLMQDNTEATMKQTLANVKPKARSEFEAQSLLTNQLAFQLLL